jgi:hypothetical protein
VHKKIGSPASDGYFSNRLAFKSLNSIGSDENNAVDETFEDDESETQSSRSSPTDDLKKSIAMPSGKLSRSSTEQQASSYEVGLLNLINK